MNQQRPRGMRPVLLLVVYGVFLVVVGVTATLQTGLLSLHFSTAAMNATVAADAAIVRTFANGELVASDLDDGGSLDAERAAGLEADLAALATRAGLERIDIRSPSGTILLSTQAGVRGSVVPASDAFAAAASGATNAAILNAGQPTDAAIGATADHPVLRAYLPLIDANGSTDAVAAVWRNAAPIIGALGHVQEQMLAVTLAAAGVAALILYLVFRAPTCRINRQTEALLEATRRDPLTGRSTTARWSRTWPRPSSGPARPAARSGSRWSTSTTSACSTTPTATAPATTCSFAVAGLWREHRRRHAMTGRYGPDEFLVIAPAAGGRRAAEPVDRPLRVRARGREPPVRGDRSACPSP